MGTLTALPEEDTDLVDRVLAGDRHAFTDLVRRHDDVLRGVAYKILGDRQRMDDVMQDAYVRAYRSMGSFRRDARLSTWLHRIVTNACIDELRRAGRRPTPVDVTDAQWDRPVDQAGPERVALAGDVLLRGLATLPYEQRAALVLVDGQGYDHQTVAEVLGVAVGTVASRVSRARAALRATIDEDR